MTYYQLLNLNQYCTHDAIKEKCRQLINPEVTDDGFGQTRDFWKHSAMNLVLNVLGNPAQRIQYDRSIGKPDNISPPPIILTESDLNSNKFKEIEIPKLVRCPACQGDCCEVCNLCQGGVNSFVTVSVGRKTGLDYKVNNCAKCDGVSKFKSSNNCGICHNGFLDGHLYVSVALQPDIFFGSERDVTITLTKFGHDSRYPHLWEPGDIHLTFIRQSNPRFSRTPEHPQELANGSSEQQNSNAIKVAPLVGIVPPGNGDGSSESAINEPVGPILPEDNDVNEERMDVDADRLSTDSTDEEHSGPINDDKDSGLGDGMESDDEQSGPLITSTFSQLKEGREQVELIPAHISDQGNEKLPTQSCSGIKTFTLENSSALVVKNHSTSTTQSAHDAGMEVIDLDENDNGQAQSESVVITKAPFLSFIDVNGNQTPMKQTGEPSTSPTRLLCENSPESVAPRVMENNKAIHKTVLNDLSKLKSHPSEVPNEECLTTEAQTNLPPAKDVDAMTAKIKTGGTSTSLDRCLDKLVCNANNDSVNLPGTPISDDDESGCTIQQDRNADADTTTGGSGKSSIKRNSAKAKLGKASQPSKKDKGKSFTMSAGGSNSSAGFPTSTSSLRASNSSAQFSPPTSSTQASNSSTEDSVSYTKTCKSSEEPYNLTPRNEKRKERAISPDITAGPG